MSSGLVLAGLGLAAIGFGGRLLSRQMPKAAQAFEQTVKSFPASQGSWANSKYYKGGFEPKMSKREAALILGVSPNAQVKNYFNLLKMKILAFSQPPIKKA
jgi:DnaJ family protein C protein 19